MKSKNIFLVLMILVCVTLGLKSMEESTAISSPILIETEDCLSKKHGYVLTPRSRVFKCSAAGGNLNTGCGNVQYEPQSVEFLKGYPKIGEVGPGPADGELASVGLFPELDEQSATRWHKEILSPGNNEYYWKYTAVHRTTKYDYFITKKDWNPNKPLTRSAFETKPFTTIDGEAQIPFYDEMMIGLAHEVDIPERQGYHIIYCVWEIDDTVNSFYSIIDVDFGE